jgi:hypothetical protein
MAIKLAPDGLKISEIRAILPHAASLLEQCQPSVLMELADQQFHRLPD